MQNITRLIRTTRFLKQEQIVGRLRFAQRKKAAIRKSSNAVLLSDIVSERAGEDVQRVAAETVASLTILNQDTDLTAPIDWNPSDQPYLWRFNLHYFNYLHQLDEKDSRAIIADWLNSNPVGLEPGWHPYPTSLRIINWIKRGVFDSEILASLYRQSEYLHNLTETHLGGNHLLENARALVFAGTFFDKDPAGSRWIEHGLDIYRRELPEQVLADGGHYERSPMYHAIVLEGLLDLLELLPETNREIPAWLSGCTKMMLDFLVSVTHPDGQIALFNDATREIAKPTASLVARGINLLHEEPVYRTTFPETGYFVHRNEDVFLCIDGGPIGPDHLPAHAHGDIFSYELSIAGKQFVVDSGVFEYEEGDMRDYVRSTAAHNALEVDHLDQAEFWSSFRVARRYGPEAISFITNNQGSEFKGEFAGYASLIGDGLVHRREIRCDDGQCRITITDTLKGRGNHIGISRIHLHPEVDIRRVDSGFALTRDGIEVLLDAPTSSEVEESWYCPEFGTRLANSVIEIEVRPGNAVRYEFRYNTK